MRISDFGRLKISWSGLPGFHMNDVRQRGRGATLSPCAASRRPRLWRSTCSAAAMASRIDMAMVRRITELSSYRPRCSCGLCSAAARVKAAAREIAEADRVGNRGLAAAEQDQIDAALPSQRHQREIRRGRAHAGAD